MMAGVATLTLTEFLLARIAEDEAANDSQVAAEVARCRADGMPDTTDDEVRAFWGGQDWWRRQLAEVEAKRWLVEEVYDDIAIEFGWGHGPGETMLKLLALPYADHPDYRDEWRPQTHA